MSIMVVTATATTYIASGHLGPLTTTYSPSGASCSTIYQSGENGKLVCGTVNLPEATSQCLPTNYTPLGGFYYSPGVCPLGYTIACTSAVYSGSDSAVTGATCCPSGGYQCRQTRVPADPLACESSITEYLTLSYDVYSTVSGEVFVTSNTAVFTPGNFVYAEAVVVRRAEDDPTWSGISTTSSTSSQISTSTAYLTSTSVTPESGLGGISSSGLTTSSAKIGLGIGISLGVLVILSAIFGALVIMKRKRKSISLDQIEGLSEGHGKPQDLRDTGPLIHELPGWVGPCERNGQTAMAVVHPDSPPQELMGSRTHWQQYEET